MSRLRLTRKGGRQRIAKDIPVRKMIPNIVTFLAAASGVTSIRYSCQGSWKAAVAAILIAALLDGLDGRVARMLRATSKLGAELDSLADFVSFGVAPGVLVYFWAMQYVDSSHILHGVRNIFWGVALFYAMCCAFRLARFNIMLEDDTTEPYWRFFFKGLPAPGGAGLVMLPLIWQIHTDDKEMQTPLVGGISLLICGILMASGIPTFSAKSIRLPARLMVPVLLLVVFLISMLVAQFWITLSIIGFIYVGSIPICVLAFRRLKEQYEKQAAVEAGDGGG